MLSHTTEITIEILLIEEEGSHLFVEAKINEKKSRLLIDTGASRTVFDQERIRLFLNDEAFVVHNKLSTGLGTNNMPTSGVNLKKVSIGTLHIKDFEAVLLDLSHVNETYKKLKHKPIDGVIGNDILAGHDAIIDYGKKSLKLKL